MKLMYFTETADIETNNRHKYTTKVQKIFKFIKRILACLNSQYMQRQLTQIWSYGALLFAFLNLMKSLKNKYFPINTYLYE